MFTDERNQNKNIVQHFDVCESTKHHKHEMYLFTVVFTGVDVKMLGTLYIH